MSRKGKARDPDTPLLEWACGAIGLVLFLGVIALTAMNGVRQGGPPAFDITQTAVRTDVQGFQQISFSVANVGDEAAAGVEVAVSLTQAGQAIETRNVTIDLIPPHSSREATAIFFADPAAHDVTFEALGYLKP